MAPPKRSRQHIESGSDDEVEIQEARSSFSRGSQASKRARVSLHKAASIPPSRAGPSNGGGNRDDDDDVSSDDDDAANDSDDSATAPGSPPQTQYELMRDNGFRHLENTDLDDHLATQKLARRSTQMFNNMVAESGIIESVECINFMCHERLHVELGPLINFIVGENGSGKSAVLTALTLCLGGKASDTNRGGSLKTFVKNGRDQGTLIVKIKNAGSDAYKPELYGRTITVERFFSKTGTSGFRLKSETDKVISTKKQDVEEISEWYALQMGNPLTVLSQDNARQFLNAATPAQKYKYFVSGVQLEQLDNDYKLSQDSLDKTLLLQEDLTEKIAQRKKEKEEAERLADTAKQNEGLRAKLGYYRNQLAWSQVVEVEKELEKTNNVLTERDRELEGLQRECDRTTEGLKEREAQVARAQEERNALRDNETILDEKVDSAQTECDDIKKAQSEMLLEERYAQSTVSKLERRIQSTKEEAEVEEKRLEQSDGPARAQRENALNKANAKVSELENKLKESKAKSASFHAGVGNADQVLSQAKGLREQKYRVIENAEKAVRQLRNSTGSVSDGFDSELLTLAEAVSRDRGFENKPLGPVGSHIRLRKPEWSALLERTLGDTLNAFVVQSKRDHSRLSGHMRRMNMRRQPPIFIASSSRIDTSSQEPEDRFDTILRVLEFENDLIRSQLILSHMIEKIILIKDRAEANEVMMDSNGPPRNVAACICFHDGKSKRGHGLRLTNRPGGLSSSPITPSFKPSRMQSDVGRQVAVQEENLRMLRLELQEIKEGEDQAKAAKEQCDLELRQSQTTITNLENNLRHARADVVQITDDLDSLEGVDDRLKRLREQRADLEKEVECLETQLGNMRENAKAMVAQLNEAKKKLRAEQLEKDDYVSRVTKANEKVKSAEALRKVAVAEKNNAFENFEIGRENQRRGKANRETIETQLAEFIEEAKSISPDRVHIPEDETPSSISKKYQKLMKQIKDRQQKVGMDDEEIFRQAEAKIKAYKQDLKRAQGVDEDIQMLKEALEQRLHLWRQFQRQISARIRIQFNYLLSERGFRGRIDLDHRSRKINIQIEPDQTRKSAAGRNTKTLSGGEKSFSSICMLLSIWEAIGSPIRCLDEFDVFMDNVNRAISTEMLVNAARRSVSRQYILITPNAIEGRARLDKDVKIIRLSDPRQRTLI